MLIQQQSILGFVVHSSSSNSVLLHGSKVTSVTPPVESYSDFSLLLFKLSAFCLWFSLCSWVPAAGHEKWPAVGTSEEQRRGPNSADPAASHQPQLQRPSSVPQQRLGSVGSLAARPRTRARSRPGQESPAAWLWNSSASSGGHGWARCSGTRWLVMATDVLLKFDRDDQYFGNGGIDIFKNTFSKQIFAHKKFYN